MTHAQIAARSRGGMSRAQKYSHEQLSVWSHLGGRPRREVVFSHQPASANINLKEERLAAVSFQKLLRLVKELYPELY
jgi:hypothetical protein